MLEHSFGHFATLPAFSNMGSSITYAELDQSSRDFAAYLQQSTGLVKGERVAIMLPNLLQYPVALFGVLRAGLVAVNVNPQYTPSELEHQLEDSGAKAILVLENFAHTVQEVLDRNPALSLVVFTTEVGDMLPVVKEVIANVLVKYVKKMVPGWKIPGAIEFNAALRAGRSQRLNQPPRQCPLPRALSRAGMRPHPDSALAAVPGSATQPGPTGRFSLCDGRAASARCIVPPGPVSASPAPNSSPASDSSRFFTAARNSCAPFISRNVSKPVSRNF